MSAQRFLQITPPQSFTGPPTPPATEEIIPTSISQILATIKRRRDGYRLPTDEISWRRFSLDAHDYRDFERQLRKVNLWGYFDDKTRLLPISRVIFVLRVPSPLHDDLASSITQEILHQSRTIAQSGSSSAMFARGIKSNSTSTFNFYDKAYGPHSPDASFKHRKARFSSVILEVSYSQKRKDLSRLADEYLLGSDARIRVVIGIDVEYRGTKKACVSIWRPHFGVNDVGLKELSALQTVTDQFFRDSAGNLISNPQASLHLPLEDFGAEDIGAKLTDLTQSIHISAEMLFDFLESAEDEARLLKEGEELAPSTPWVLKRKRESAPPEQLDSDRESIFAEQEQRAEKKARMDDSSYKASSSE
ncbi:hypothetical protein MMC07_007668 [Pseudocyphellaria aurata]|nr:hypothetical protein [Pseudocyphellaria aurata]